MSKSIFACDLPGKQNKVINDDSQSTNKQDDNLFSKSKKDNKKFSQLSRSEKDELLRIVAIRLGLIVE